MCLRWSSLVERAAASSISSFSFSRCVSLSVDKKVIVINAQHLSLPSFQESFTPEVKEGLHWDSHKRENANLVLRGKIKGHGFQGREGPVTLKNKYGTFKQQCATKIVRRNRRCITQYSYSGNLL